MYSSVGGLWFYGREWDSNVYLSAVPDWQVTF